MNPYRQRIWQTIETVLSGVGPLGPVLDFGCGDGWFASQLSATGLVSSLTPIDVTRREKTLVEPLLYDGARLPFPDASFDLVYSIDVLHHCPAPQDSLRDLLRCSARYLLIKDHNHHGWLGKMALAVMDELGNRRFGIPSPYLYQERWNWLPLIEAAGFRQLTFIHPMACHTGVMGAATNSLQFLGLWERQR
ncbi:MAG: class I SAM-dependent methyltransferase [Aquabacterium sp.]|nr:class I SAM-dependent methyltransferase [Aquabacterium sp.]